MASPTNELRMFSVPQIVPESNHSHSSLSERGSWWSQMYQQVVMPCPTSPWNEDSLFLLYLRGKIYLGQDTRVLTQVLSVNVCVPWSTSNHALHFSCVK